MMCLMVSQAGEGTKTVDEFNKATFIGDFDVKLKQGDTTSVKYINKDGGLDDSKIQIRVEKGVLKVSLKNDLYVDAYALTIIVTYKTLNDIKAKMGCRVENESVLTGKRIALSGETGGKIKTKVMCEEIDISAGSGCKIDVEGTADRGTYFANLGGTVAAVDLVCKKVNAEIRAGGDIICHAVEKLHIDIASGGTVTYKGNPEDLEEKIFLGGKVKKVAPQPATE